LSRSHTTPPPPPPKPSLDLSGANDQLRWRRESQSERKELTFRSGGRPPEQPPCHDRYRLATRAAKDDVAHPRMPLATIANSATPPKADALTPKMPYHKKPCRCCCCMRGRSQRHRALPPPPRGAISLRLAGPPRDELPAHRWRSPPPIWESPAPPPREWDPGIRRRRHRTAFGRWLTPVAVVKGGGERSCSARVGIARPVARGERQGRAEAFLAVHTLEPTLHFFLQRRASHSLIINCDPDEC
jgi:hypothetical protein